MENSQLSIPLLKKLNNYGRNGLKSPIRGTEVGELLKGYKSLSDLLPELDKPAICESTNSSRIPLTHRRLKQFVTNDFDLSQFGIPPGNRIGLLLPNGPELAVAVIATVSQWCAAPINPTNTWEEIKMELQSTKSIAIIIQSGASVNDAALKAAKELGIGVLAISALGSISGLFRLTELTPINSSMIPSNQPTISGSKGFITYDHPEIVLLLHTSGTSGNKKLVPYSLDMIIIGVGCIVSSWNLCPNDVCLNMMPLFHIGGIVRNIFSPVLSGGAVITCSGFDPVLFWDILYHTRDNYNDASGHKIPLVTWYYAAPTMHHAILNEAERRPTPLPIESVRYIANAAGGLLPVLAASLRDTFKAVILTSYGMTECMPISTPPQNYALDPVGTSGTAVGPDILIVDDDLKALPINQKGNIFVRGPPCFGGYENNGSANEESFFSVEGHGHGWFNTGDMGSLDDKGYLFISGRSKEIINRGGETISPFEIEEAVVQHPFVKETIAFSAPHEQYQETVGAIIVTRPGKPRVDLVTLHKYLESKLHRSKWPQIIIFSDGLPKNAAGKTLRIKYADRIGIKSVDEESTPSSRLFEAKCPPIGTALTVPISLKQVQLDYAILLNFLINRFSQINQIQNVTIDLPSNPETIVIFVSWKEPSPDHNESGKLLEAMKQSCATELDSYLVPSYFYALPALPMIMHQDNQSFDRKELQRLAMDLYQQQYIQLPRNNIEKQIELIWRSMLGCPTILSVTASFFDLGGDSLKAGQIVGAMRQQLRVPLSVADLFTSPTIEAMAIKISTSKALGSPQITSASREQSPHLTPPSNSLMRNEKRKLLANKYQSKLASIEEERKDQLEKEYLTWEFAPPLSNTSFGCLFVQSLPITVIYPLRRIIIWFLIAGPWVYLMKQGYGRFTSLLAAMFIARLILGIFAPLLGIAAKWLIIGRYKAGKYPLWGTMYLKWWIVEQLINIMGKGFFRDDLPIIGPYLVRWYYILMGAKIGKNVKIHKDAKIGQADLLSIGDNVAIDNCIIRPFSLEEGHFVLMPIEISDNCSIGLKSVISSGAVLPPDTHIGPLSSSHEMELDSDPVFRTYCRPTYDPPPVSYIIFLGIPILLIVLAVSFIPWFIVLKTMVSHAKAEGWYKSDLHSIYHAFLWWITPYRLFYFFILRMVRRCVVPFIRLFMIIVIKKIFVGKFTVMNEEEKQLGWNRFRYWLMAKLLPGGGLAGVAKLVGTHYEIISIIFRLLGAKIGKNIYWPGSGLEIVEYDLLEVGDNVVFGSRSVILTSTTKSSKKVIFEPGTMVADRCVILPGVVLQRGAVLGSGALAAEDMILPTGSVWLGSQGGKALNVAPPDPSYAVKDTKTPFAKAFYDRKAKFFVIPLWMIVIYNTVWQAFCTCFRNCPTALSLIICSYLMKFDPFDDHSPLELFKMSYIAFAPLHVTLCLIALFIDISSKWLILGRRQAGEYPWDESSYCQRWQLYLTIQEIRRGERRKTGILDMIQGSQYLVWYFRALGANIGTNVCLFPNGGDPMFTEPDLVTIGDFAAIDDASLIAHINTRGIFRLNPLNVGTGCILKPMSRLLSGASMESHTVLQEHTLVLAGELVEAGSVWQGWPSRSQISLKEYRARINYLLNEVSHRNLQEFRAFNLGGDRYQALSTREDGNQIESDKLDNAETGISLSIFPGTIKSNSSAGDLAISITPIKNKGTEKEPLLGSSSRAKK